ncbi:MAG: mechanosensitive ion channel domain-containing protein, partial [Rickettsiales bacterium]
EVHDPSGLVYEASGLGLDKRHPRFIGTILGAAPPLLRDRLAVSHASRSVAKFWLRVFVDAGFIGIGMILVALVWGISKDELWRWVHAGVTGFSLGSIRVSLLDIVIALTIFVGLLLVTRVIQRVLSDRVLPQTQLEPGIQHSVAAGFGYVGMVLAATLGITALGIDLSNLAIIAGALSVGIGFGLQNIINNFVSGIIIFAEQPIAIGDRIEVGGVAGRVKKISLRSTTVVTNDNITMIVPNGDFISQTVTNWSHGDPKVRIRIPIGVAYGTDTALVE